MLRAALKALNDLTSPDLRWVLIKSILLSVALFAALFFGLEFLMSGLASLTWSWLAVTLQFAAGIGLFAAFFFLMAPVTALFAGLYQDGIAAALEQRHYPKDAHGRALSVAVGLGVALKFAALAIGVEVVAISLVVFAGLGAIVFWLANAYLISREYFELAAARHMPLAEAATLRHAHAVRVFITGLIPATLAMIPFINFTTPVFATAYYLHLFKQGPSSWV